MDNQERMKKASELRDAAERMRDLADKAGLTDDEGIERAARQLCSEADELWPGPVHHLYRQGRNRLTVEAHVDTYGHVTLICARDELREHTGWGRAQVMQVPVAFAKEFSKLVRTIAGELEDLDVI